MNELEKNQRFWSVVLFVGMIIGLIWLLVGIFVLLLTYVSTPMPVDSFYEEIPTAIVNGEKIDFIFTDNNNNEDLIIRTDRKTYSGVGITEADIYISIQNKSEKDQFVNLQTFFSNNDRKIISIARLEKDVEPYSCGFWDEKIYIERTCVDKWTEEFLSDFSETENTILTKDISIKYKKGFQAKKKNQFSIKKDETIFLKARIEFPPHIQDEFFIEAIGSEGGYGHLDPYIDSDIMKEDWDNLIGWTDQDDAGAVSEINPAGQLYLDLRAIEGNGDARRTKDIGTIGTGDYWVETKFKGDVWDGFGDVDFGIVSPYINAGTNRLLVRIGNNFVNPSGDGILVHDGDGWIKVLAKTWDTNWHTASFFVHNSQTDVDIWIDTDPATEEADITDADCSLATAGDGVTYVYGFGTIAGNGEYHIDYLYVGTELLGEEPPPSDYFVNDLITQITDEGTYYRAWWSIYTIQCANGDEFLFKQQREFWDYELEEWELIGSASIGIYPCEQPNGGWYYKNDTNWFIIKEDLTEFGTGYYRLKMWAGNEDFGENDPYILLHWNGVDLVLSDDVGIPMVSGVSPGSGTEIIDIDTLLEIDYENLSIYDSLYVSLRHPQTGILTNARQYDISDIGGNGELEINLQDFNIEKNANWYLHAVATYEGYQYEGEYFLSGYGWNWTDDLTDGTYYLNINIEGFEEIFVVSDFETWYSENAKFDEPTAMFSAIASVFDNIFSVIGEFGNRIVDYFKVNESYAQGYEIGRTISYFRYFVDQISLFLGGFPILLWLFIIILLLTGIFIFRLILKFIPFLGGS